MAECANERFGSKKSQNRSIKKYQCTHNTDTNKHIAENTIRTSCKHNIVYWA